MFIKEGYTFVVGTLPAVLIGFSFGWTIAKGMVVSKLTCALFWAVLLMILVRGAI